MSNIYLTRPVSPCRGCTERKISDDFNCHSVCEAYLSYRAKIDAESAGKRRQIDLNDALWNSRGRRKQ